jgi:hypothetical protein
VEPVLKEGWGRTQLYQYFAKFKFKTGCEVGVKFGANAQLMFKHIPGLRMYLVEPYTDYELTDYVFGQWRHNLHMSTAVNTIYDKKNPLDAKFILEKSEDGVRKIKDGCLDFVYIDGNHHYDFCMLDIILYSRKVRSGGIVSGHDYVIDGVKNAVNDYVRSNNISEFFITDKKCKGSALDKNISWYFFKGE